MRSTWKSYPWVVALLLSMSVAPVGCKEGNPLSGDITPATPGFIPEEPPQGVTERIVTLRTGSITGSRIVLDIVVHEVDEPVSGIVMKLTYPQLFSKFTACTDGELLPPGDCIADEPAPGSGEVLIVRSVVGADQATEVIGEKVIARVEFLIFGVSEGDIVIEGQNLGGGDASALLDAEGEPIWVKWYSGTLVGL